MEKITDNQVQGSRNREKSDEDELMNRISKRKNRRNLSDGEASAKVGGAELGDDTSDEIEQMYVQWTTSDNKTFFPASKSVKQLDPGLYDIRQTSQGHIFFEHVPMTTENILRFPETNSEAVVKEIEMFWNKEKMFVDHNLTFKRGVLLWGPPGGGKTCTIKLAIHDLIKRNGIVVKFTHPTIFSHGVRILRDIQKHTPVIVLMEDIDAIIEHFNESEVINILDGVDMIEKVVFLATTNYPEKLGARILNRPSRFDRRFKIGMPNEQSRKMYIERLLDGKKDVDVARWVADTDQLSIAHIRELFIAVVFLENDYEIALKRLKGMSDSITSEHDGGKISL